MPGLRCSRGGFRSLMMVLTCGASVFITGCSSPVEFNQKIVAANARVKSVFEQMENALKGKDFKTAKVQLDNVKKAIGDVKTEMKTWKVPDRQSAKDLHQGYEKYLTSMEGVLNDWGKLIPMLEKGEMSGVQSLAEKIDATTNRELVQLQNLQKAFAKDYNIKLQ